MSGTLYLVATPIGNLEDITLRAIKVLNNADLVLAEDTRNSKKLFAKHLIKTPLSAYHDFSSERKTQSIIKLLKNGKIIALVSDAGTPLISDPGFELVRKAIKENIKIYSIPGPSSVISGLITSGFNNNRFIFEGFLPRKSSDLKKIVTSFKYESRTIILFESPKRIQKSLKIMLDILGEIRQVSIARELTKIHETILRMSIKEANLLAKTDPNLSKGEIVIILEGVDKKFSDFDIKLDELFKYLREDISLKKFSKAFSKVSSYSAKEIYNRYKEKV